jgi:hypothetical protein
MEQMWNSICSSTIGEQDLAELSRQCEACAHDADDYDFIVIDGKHRTNLLIKTLTTNDFKDSKMYYDVKKKEFFMLLNKENNLIHQINAAHFVDTYKFIDFVNSIDKSNLSTDLKRIYKDEAKRICKIIYDFEISYFEIKGNEDEVKYFLQYLNSPLNAQ